MYIHPPLAWSRAPKATSELVDVRELDGAGSDASDTADDTAAASPGGPGPAWRARVESFVVPIAIFAVATVCHFIVVWPTARVNHRAISAYLMKWDSGWYIRLAKLGYPNHLPPANRIQTTAGFYPLYALFERWALHLTPFGERFVAIGIAAGSSALAMVALWHLTARLCDPSTATRAVALTAFAAGRDRLVDGLQRGRAPAVRDADVADARRRALAPRRPVGRARLPGPTERHRGRGRVPGRRDRGVARNRRDFRPLIAPALAALGAIALPVYDQIHTHDGFAYWKTQKIGWKQSFDGGISTLRSLWHFAHHPLHDFNVFFAALALAVLAGGIVLLVRWRPPAPILAYAAVIVILTFGATAFVSTFRMILVGVPFTIAYAVVLKRSDVFAITLAVSAVLFATLATAATTVLYTP